MTLMVSRQALGFHPGCRVSQVPRPTSRRAPSPTTPPGPRAALTRCFTHGVRLQHLWKTGHLKVAFRGRIGFACATAHVFASGGSGEQVTPQHRSVGYTCERATHMVDSFHSTRLTRLSLAHQRRKARKEEGIASTSHRKSSLFPTAVSVDLHEGAEAPAQREARREHTPVCDRRSDKPGRDASAPSAAQDHLGAVLGLAVEDVVPAHAVRECQPV